MVKSAGIALAFTLVWLLVFPQASWCDWEEAVEGVVVQIRDHYDLGKRPALLVRGSGCKQTAQMVADSLTRWKYRIEKKGPLPVIEVHDCTKRNNRFWERRYTKYTVKARAYDKREDLIGSFEGTSLDIPPAPYSLLVRILLLMVFTLVCWGGWRRVYPPPQAVPFIILIWVIAGFFLFQGYFLPGLF